MEGIGLEACSLSAWLYESLVAAGLPAVCIETRRAKAAMGAMPDKTDRNGPGSPSGESLGVGTPVASPRSSAPAGTGRCT